MTPIASIRPASLAFFVLLALSGLALKAQDEAPAPKAARPPAVDVITLDFPGGPLSKLAAKLNETGDAKLSIVQSPGLDPVLPAFSVRGVRTHAVIAALGRILEPQGFALNPVDHNLAVLAKIDGARPNAFASFQLEGKIGDRTAEEVVAAIQQGCEFANPEGKPSTLRFKYHPGTKLLFVAGTPLEVEVADRVFASLPNVPRKAPNPEPEKK